MSLFLPEFQRKLLHSLFLCDKIKIRVNLEWIHI